MAGEHVILLDEQDKPTGMLEKYAAHTLNTLCISRFPAGCSMNKANCWSRAARWAKKPGQAYGRTQSAGIRKPAKPLNRPLSAVAALSSASR
ncbi:isopentenyl-diphosphate delta-isomerase [Klebsiella oxytoca]|nr:isopentenyl-diphosphate delta-isomerase [Klebsiella oxytoca]